MTTPLNLTFPQADAIIDQLTTRIHELIGTDYRDAAIVAADRAAAEADRAEAAADTAVTGVPDGAVTRPKLGPDVVAELEGKADLTEVPTTAADVGARPDTWTPTAQEVGARPDTWMPTASDVGAREASWTPTAADVGALPATWRPSTSDLTDYPGHTVVLGSSAYGKIPVRESGSDAIRVGTIPTESYHAAAKEYVDRRIQLVTSWPASPTPGVLYLMEE